MRFRVPHVRQSVMQFTRASNVLRGRIPLGIQIYAPKVAWAS